MKRVLILLISLVYADVFEGYTLYTSDDPYTTYLIDNDYNVINQWGTECQGSTASMGYLLPDSTLIYPCKQTNPVISSVAATGGRIIKYNWNGDILWDWSCEWEYQLHHDIEPTPNGTILAIAMENIDGFKPDVVLEIEPVGMHNANLVWVWKVSEHMSDDINNPYTFYEDVGYANSDWNHFNAINLNEYGKILLSSRNWGEIYIIEWGENRNLLYRWGNPQNYGRDGEQILYAQHGVNQIPIGYPGEGNIILFNNMSNQEQQGGSSIIVEFTPPIDYYIEDGEPFGPTEPVWTFEEDFYSPKQSGAFRLPNGNTFVSVAQGGDMFEVTYDGEIVWEHQVDGINRAQKYSLDYFSILGDVNNDGIINILDIVILVGYILENLHIENADLNGDEMVNVLDIVILVGIILNV